MTAALTIGSGLGGRVGRCVCPALLQAAVRGSYGQVGPAAAAAHAARVHAQRMCRFMQQRTADEATQ